MTWQDALLAFLCFAILGWLVADSFILRNRVRRLQRIVEGFAARIVAQSDLLSRRAEKDEDSLWTTTLEETADVIRSFGVHIEDNGV